MNNEYKSNMATHTTLLFFYTYFHIVYTLSHICLYVKYMTTLVYAFECFRKHVKWELLTQQKKREWRNADYELVNSCLKYILNKCWFNFFRTLFDWCLYVPDVRLVWKIFINPILVSYHVYIPCMHKYTCSNKHFINKEKRFY